MTKNDIKNGMYVRLRNGYLTLAIAKKLLRVDGQWNSLDCYDDETLTNNVSNEWDIMEIYVSSSPILFKEDAFERIWVRESKHSIVAGDIYVDPSDGEKLIVLAVDKHDDYQSYQICTVMSDNYYTVSKEDAIYINTYFEFKGHDEDIALNILNSLNKFNNMKI